MNTQIKTLLNIVILLFCVCSCRNISYPNAMQTADSIVNSLPDSAIVLLEQLKDSIHSEPESTQMYYHLLSIKAKDKAYIPHTSDSLILQIVHYYENVKDKKHLPEAYYYAGRICRDLGDAPQALDYFQKAVDTMDNVYKNYKLLSRIYSQMGTLYLYQDIYNESMTAFKKSHHYNTITKDSIAMIFSLRDIGDSFTGYGNTDSALFYYKKAYEQAQLVGKQHYIDMVQVGLSSLYKQLKQFDLAKRTLQSPMKNLTQERQNALYAISADLYYQTDKLDSASYFYNMLIHIGNIYNKQTSHRRLAEIAKKKSNFQDMLEHINLYVAYTDSIQKITATEIVHKMQSLYNYQLRAKENHLLRIRNAKQKSLIIHSLLILITLLAFILIYVQYNKRKKYYLKEQLIKLKKIKDEQYQKSSQFIEANNLRIRELEEKLENTTEQNSVLQNLLEIQKEQIIQINNKIATDLKANALSEQLFKQSNIYNYFHIAAYDDNIKISKEDWEKLQTHIDSCYKDFTLRLRALYPISNIELQICLLLKANIPITGIAKLTGRSKSAIVSARKKLYEKVFSENGKPEQWDAFIMSL